MSTFIPKLIPYVIFDVMANDTFIEYGSTSEDELYNCLINEVKRYMEIHDYDDDDDDNDNDDDNEYHNETNLICDECECRVISNKYITFINGKNFCGSCNPLPNDNIIVNKETYKRFTKFLQKNGEKCDIIYFKDGKWFDFAVI